MNSLDYVKYFLNTSCEIITFENNEEWLKLRQCGIGGSDVGPILGYSTFKTAKDVYKDKKEITEQKHSFAIDFGNEFEPILFNTFKAKYKDRYDVFDFKKVMFRNRWFPFLQASLDGVLFDKLTNQVGVLEIKTAQERKGKWYDRYGNRIVPTTYFYQAIHYFNVTNADYVIFFVLINYENSTSDKVMEILQPRIYYRKDCIQYMNYAREECSKFWHNNVLKNIPPNTRLRF